MDVDRILAKANEEAKRRNYDYAIRLFQEILSLRPNVVEARRGLRRAALKKHQKRYPSRLSAMLRGILPLISIRMQKAAKRHQALLVSCERYLQNDPRNLRVNQILGDAAAAAGLPDTAIAVFEELAEMRPDEPDVHKSLGDLYHQKGRIDEALTAYERALELRPHDADVQKARKNLAAEGAIRTSGIDRAQSSRELVKDEQEMRAMEANKRLVKTPEEIASAIEEAEEALKADPQNVQRIRELAELNYQKGDVEEAIEVLEEALELQPDSEALKTRLGEWKLRRSRDRVAALVREGNEAALEKARSEDVALRVEEHGRRVKAHPTDLRHRFHYGCALVDAGEVDGAISQFQQTIRDPKHRLESLLRLGDCFFRKKMYDLAAKQLREALEAASGAGSRELEIHYTLGLVHEAMGDRKAALDSFSRVYERDIQYRDVAGKIQSLGEATPEGESPAEPNPGRGGPGR